MLAGVNNDQQQARVNEIINRIQNAYNNTGKIRKFVSVTFLIPVIFSISLIHAFSITLALVSFVLRPKRNESKLTAWPKKIVNLALFIAFGLPIIALVIFTALSALFLYLVNQAFFVEIRQIFHLIREMPAEERGNFIQNAVNIFATQTTHDPSAVSSVNLSVDRLIEKYKGSLSKEEFYEKLNLESTTEIEDYIRQLTELTEEKKSNALKCLEFINSTTGDSFKDNYSNLTLKQVAILCWKACNDRNTGMEGKGLPLSDEDIKDRRNMFINGLVDAATTYGNQGQSCPGGTYNKMVESLSALHPLVVITLDEKEASQIIKEAITLGFPKLAQEVFKELSKEEKEKVQDELPKLSSEMVKYIMNVREALKQKCKQFSSRLKDNERKEVLNDCIIHSLPYVEETMLSQPGVTPAGPALMQQQ